MSIGTDAIVAPPVAVAAVATETTVCQLIFKYHHGVLIFLHSLGIPITACYFILAKAMKFKVNIMQM